MTAQITLKFPSIPVESIKGPWLAKLVPVPGAQRSWSPKNLTKNFLRWVRKTETHTTYVITEPGIYQGICGRPEFDARTMNHNIPLKKQATRFGLFEVISSTDSQSGAPTLKLRKLQVTNQKTGDVNPDWNTALNLLFPETTGAAADYMTKPGTNSEPPLFDFDKDTRTAAENAEQLDLPRYNRVDCKVCSGRGHLIEHRQLVAETDTVVKIPALNKNGKPSKTKTISKVVHASEVAGTFPAPGKACACCGGKGFYLQSIDTVDPITFLMTRYMGSAVTQTACESVLEAREQAALAAANNEPAPPTKTTYWIEYAAGEKRRAVIEHWSTSDPLSPEDTVPIESWNEKIDAVVNVLNLSADEAPEAISDAKLNQLHGEALWLNETYKRRAPGALSLSL